MRLSTRQRAVALWLTWLAALLLMLALLVPSREQLSQTHAALLFLLIVLGASATLGFIAGTTMAVLGFLLLTIFFEYPYDRLDIPSNIDLIELGSYLTVALVAARLLTVSRRRAELAEARSREIETLARERSALSLEAATARGLAESNRMKDALLATVSHDLRTPLTTIRALAERRSVSGDDDWSLVQDETARLSHLVNELLDFSRIRGGALPVRLETYAAEDLVGAVSHECGARFGAHVLQTDITLSGEVLAGYFDLALSTRILVNLVENAIKYGEPDARVQLVVRREADQLLFMIDNVGPPIAVADRERIFEPFTRGSAPRTHARGAGVGLGLAIARALAEMQRGTLTLVDHGEAQTRFALRVSATSWADAPEEQDTGPL